MYTVDIKGDITDNTMNLINEAIAQPDPDVMLNISSYGGNLSVGMVAYDKIRGAKDKRFFANVIDVCMSSASLFLMACPIERRTANAHAVILIHNPLANVGMQSMNDVKSLLGSMEDARKKLCDIYVQRTKMNQQDVISLMDREQELYATDCVAKGIIGSVNALYNKKSNYKKKITYKNRNSMKKNFLENLTNKIVKALLKNEVYMTVDGVEIELDGLELGANASCEDGVYTLQSGEVITIENGVITDIILPEPAIENEGEESEDAPAEEAPKAEEEVKPEEAEAVAEEVAEAVEEIETVEDATEVAEQVKEIVEEELVNYKKMKTLINKLGGMAKLEKLANVKREKKNFVSEAPKAKNEQRSIKELVALKRK